MNHKRKAGLAVATSAMLGLSIPLSVSTVDAATPVQVTMFATPSTQIINMNTNWFTKYVEKKFSMNITWIEAPSSDELTKESLLLESGKYPSVFWAGSFTPVQALQYGTEGIFLPLNDLLKKYAPNAWHAINTVPGFKQGVTAPNGDIYGLPAYNWCWHCDWSAKMWINTKLLAKYHLSMPTTTAQFEHVLEVFKQHGIDPLTGATVGPGGGWHSNPTTFLMNSFVYDDENGSNSDYFFINAQGNLAFAPIQPGWKQGLAYLHTLNAKGLMDTSSLTQNNTQLQAQVNSGNVGVFPYGCKQCVINNYGTPQSHFLDWAPMAPLKGPSGVQYAAFYGLPPSGATFAITNKSTPAQQIAIMKLINFLFTPVGTQMMDFGPKGKYWTYAKKGQKGLMGTQAIFNTDFNEFYNGTSQQNWGWNQLGPMYQSYQWRNGYVAYSPNTGNGSESMLQLATEQDYTSHQPKLVYPGFAWIPPAQVQQYAMYQTNITNYVNQWMDQFIAGTKSLSKDWNSYVQGLNGLGLQQYMQTTAKYMGKPFNTSSFKQSQADIKYLESLK